MTDVCTGDQILHVAFIGEKPFNLFFLWDFELWQADKWIWWNIVIYAYIDNFESLIEVSLRFI